MMSTWRIVLGMVALTGAGLLSLLGIERLVPYVGRPTVIIYPAGALLALGMALIASGLRRLVRPSSQETAPGRHLS